MLTLPRRPIDAEAMSYDRASVPLREVTTMLINNARSWRPYGAGIIRHAVSNVELKHLNSLEGQDQLDALAEASFLEPINAAMHDCWEADPWSPDFRPTDLTLRRVITEEDKMPHIDQRLRDGDDMPQGGLLVATVVLQSELEYAMWPNRRNPFNPADRDFFKQTTKPRPPRMLQLEPPAHAGDVLVMMSHTIHSTADLTDDPEKGLQPRITAAYLSGLERTN